MAFGKYQGGNQTFLNLSFKAGVFHYGKKPNVQEANFVEGIPVAAEAKKKEYEGTPYTEAQITLLDPTDQSRAVVCFACEGYGGGNLVGLFLRAAHDRPGASVKVNAWLMEKGTRLPDGTVLEKARSGASLWVAKERIKLPLFTGGFDKLPESPEVKDAKGKPVMVNGKPVHDNAERDALILESLQELCEVLSPDEGHEAPKTGTPPDAGDEAGDPFRDMPEDDIERAAAAPAKTSRGKPAAKVGQRGRSGR